jgi:hypothetical protein
MKWRTTGEYICNTFRVLETEISTPLRTLPAIAIIEAPGKMGSINGFIAPCKKDELLRNFIPYCCIFHLEAAYVEVIPLEHITNFVIITTDCIQCCAFATPTYEPPGRRYRQTKDLVLHADVRRLRKRKVLALCFSTIGEIKHFQKSKKRNSRRKANIAG